MYLFINYTICKIEPPPPPPPLVSHLSGPDNKQQTHTNRRDGVAESPSGCSCVYYWIMCHEAFQNKTRRVIDLFIVIIL